MTNHEIKIQFQEYNNLSQLPQADRNLCGEATKALEGSHSPYSNFQVGAALLLQSGKVIYGSNQENVAYPSGLCAERTALFNWGANFSADPIIAIAVTARTANFDILKPVTPCGACLQVMAECEQRQKQPIRILLYCIDGPVWATEGVESFLPFMFFEQRLATR